MAARIVSLKEFATPPYLFKCLSNPSAPAMVVEGWWPAKELQMNPEWVRVDAQGVEITTQELADEAEAAANGERLVDRKRR